MTFVSTRIITERQNRTTVIAQVRFNDEWDSKASDLSGKCTH